MMENNYTHDNNLKWHNKTRRKTYLWYLQYPLYFATI